jgi:ribosomal RNA assembly protein
MDYVRIPEERLPVLIGEGGAVKKQIEERTDSKLIIEENTVTVEGEGIGAWKAKDVVLAIGRGFSPDKALMLLNDDYVIEVIQLKEYGSGEKTWKRLKGRVIGEKGRTRRFIEKNTGAMLSVYGKTVSLIGSYDEVAVAREAVAMLLGGSQHGAVRRFLEKSAKRRAV